MSDATDNRFYREPSASVDGDPKDVETRLAEANGRNARGWGDRLKEADDANRAALGAHHKPGHTVAELITAVVQELAEAREQVEWYRRAAEAEQQRRAAEIADLRASREAWAIEAMSLDAELASRPTTDAYDKACQALELRRVALVKALGLSAATSFYDAVDQAASRPAIPADRPRVVCLCGSMRFEDEIREAAREESLFGHIVVLPLCNMKQPHPLWNDEATAEHLKTALDSLHKAKIDLADEIVVVSDASGYIGDSTRSEIAYAEAHGKPVRYWVPPISSGGDTDTTEVPGER